MGRGSSKAGVSVDIPTGGGGSTINDVISTKDMISERERYQNVTDGMLTVSRDMFDDYGDVGLNQFQIAQMKPGVSTIAYYDGTNIAFNQRYMNDARLTAAYDNTIKSGYHPSRGNKSAAEAVAAHEYGHALADAVGKKTGKDIDGASTEIVKQAMRTTGHKKASDFAKAISGYAKENTAETVAEGVSDFYCNGNNAKAESKAIMKAIDKALK